MKKPLSSVFSFKAFLALTPLLAYSLTAQALSASTANTIQGTAPYLTFDGGVTKSVDTDGLLGIKLSDGTFIIPAANALYPSATVNISTPINPILLPTGDSRFSTVSMIVPPSAPTVSATDFTQKINFTSLLTAPYNYWKDDDGDIIPQITPTTANIQAVMEDQYGVKIRRFDTLNICNSKYYKLTITSTNGSLSTKYGDPRTSNFNGSSATYYISPNTIPTACWAKPNLVPGAAANIQGTGFDPLKGFKVININNPSSNFPMTGSDQLFFDLDLVNTTAKDVIASTASQITSGGLEGETNIAGGVKLILSTTSNTSTTLNVKLAGPKPGALYPAFTRTQAVFRLNAGSTTVYSFQIGAWFIANNGQSAYGTGCNIYTGYSLVPFTATTNNPQLYNNSAPNTTLRTLGTLHGEWGKTSLAAYPGVNVYNNYITSTEVAAGSRRNYNISDDGSGGNSYVTGSTPRYFLHLCYKTN